MGDDIRQRAFANLGGASTGILSAHQTDGEITDVQILSVTGSPDDWSVTVEVDGVDEGFDHYFIVYEVTPTGEEIPLDELLLSNIREEPISFPFQVTLPPDGSSPSSFEDEDSDLKVEVQNHDTPDGVTATDSNPFGDFSGTALVMSDPVAESPEPRLIEASVNLSPEGDATTGSGTVEATVEGETLTASFDDITNELAQFEFERVPEGEHTVTFEVLETGETAEATVTVDAGTPEFDLGNFIAYSESDTSVHAAVNVTNVGDVEAEATVTFEVDGQTEEKSEFLWEGDDTTFTHDFTDLTTDEEVEVSASLPDGQSRSSTVTVGDTEDEDGNGDDGTEEGGIEFGPLQASAPEGTTEIEMSIEATNVGTTEETATVNFSADDQTQEESVDVASEDMETLSTTFTDFDEGREVEVSATVNGESLPSETITVGSGEESEVSGDGTIPMAIIGAGVLAVVAYVLSRRTLG